jgi:RNA polymerase sigma-70 factor (ECF subfamily)
MSEIKQLVYKARDGDLLAYESLVVCTQGMVFAVCFRVLGNQADALDATQTTFLRAFSRLNDIHDPASFPGWLRRVAITTARSMARKRRNTFIPMDDVPDVPALDEIETTWSESQRDALARALLQLDPDDRRICDRFYHGGWDIARLAADAGMTEPAMRKRLQRIRDRLREEAEMNEQQNVNDTSIPATLPAAVIELLARPKLIDLPENPVGRIADVLKARYCDYRLVDVPEVVEVEQARNIVGREPYYFSTDWIHFVNPHQFLRYDTTLPLLIAARNVGAPARLMAIAQVYRNQTPAPTRDQSFHQFELLVLDEAKALDPWAFMGETLHCVADLFPARSVTIEPFEYPECSQAWEIAVDVSGKPVVVLSWGIYTDAVVRHLAGDPARHTAFGLSFGLERIAALHFGYDDIRKLAAARLA